MLWFNLAVVLVGLIAFRPLLSSLDSEPPCVDETTGSGLWMPDEDVSYRLEPSATFHVRRSCNGRLSYDAHYTTDAAGARVSSPADADPADACGLLVGGSFAFGEGVDDEESLAYRVWARSEGRFELRNFGVSGYGANHVLADAESGFLAERAGCVPRWVLYLAIDDHVRRVSGSPIGSGDPDGPRYVLDDAGRALRAGNHDDVEWTPRGVARALGRTELGRRYHRRSVGSTSAYEDALYAAVVRAIGERLDASFPGIELHVLWWDHALGGPTAGPPELAGVDVHRVSRVLAPVADWEGTYELPGDGHPTARANDLLAEYVLREILEPTARP